MSVILQPQVDFPIVRQIANHLDSTVYYVQAIVRDADGNILATVNLTSQGNQRYQRRWHVVADTSGQGKYISIVTSVYTDSGYTTKSPDYGDEEETYLIFNRVLPAMRGGGSFDPESFRRVIAQELGKIEKPEPVDLTPLVPKPQEMRWDDIITALNELAAHVALLPKEKPDLTPILSTLKDISQQIEEKPVTPETDLSSIESSITSALSESETKWLKEIDDVKSAISDIETGVAAAAKDAVKESIEKTNFVTSFVMHATTDNNAVEKQKQKMNENMAPMMPPKKSFNINALAR